jgi:hypothetical protein
MSYSSTPRRSYQLDVVGEVSAAYHAVFDRLQLVGEMALLPFLVMIAVEIAVHFLHSAGSVLGAAVFGIVHAIVQLVFGLVFIVRWYRFLLLNETVGGGLIPPGWTASLVVGIKLVLFMLAAIIPIVVVTFLIPIVAPPLSLIGAIAIALVSVRVSLVFPAAAIDQPISFRTAWDWLEGNYSRLVATEFACYLPFVIVGYVLKIIARTLPSLFSIIFDALQLAVSFAGWAVVAAVLAHVYRDLVGPPHSA